MSFINSNTIHPAVSYLFNMFGNILVKGFDSHEKHYKVGVVFSDFYPRTSFEQKIQVASPGNLLICYTSDLDSQFDASSGYDRKYLCEKKSVIRLKCLALVFATPIINGINLLLNLINKIVKIITFAHFWHPSMEPLSFGERCWSFGRDLAIAIVTPVLCVALEIAALYGLISPNNGRKLYATLERSAFDEGILAPCFQPYKTLQDLAAHC